MQDTDIREPDNQEPAPVKATEDKTAPARQKIQVEEHDGFLYDKETAELVKPAWGTEIVTAEDAEKVMSAMLRAECGIAAVQLEAETLARNAMKRVAPFVSRRKDLERLYGDAVKRIGQEEMDKLGKQTWQTDFGLVGRKVVPAGLEVVDHKLAVKFCNRRKDCKDAVNVTTSVMHGKIPMGRIKELVAEPELAAANGFAIREQRTSVRLDTSPAKPKAAKKSAE